MYKVLVTGDRDWTDTRTVEAVLDELCDQHNPRDILLIAGGARGLDTIAEAKAKYFGIHVARVDALWDFYHRAAGPIRNGVMLALAPDEVIAFHDDIENSKGTKHCLEQAKKLGIPNRLITSLDTG